MCWLEKVKCGGETKLVVDLALEIAFGDTVFGTRG